MSPIKRKKFHISSNQFWIFQTPKYFLMLLQKNTLVWITIQTIKSFLDILPNIFKELFLVFTILFYIIGLIILFLNLKVIILIVFSEVLKCPFLYCSCYVQKVMYTCFWNNVFLKLNINTLESYNWNNFITTTIVLVIANTNP